MFGGFPGFFPCRPAFLVPPGVYRAAFRDGFGVVVQAQPRLGWKVDYKGQQAAIFEGGESVFLDPPACKTYGHPFPVDACNRHRFRNERSHEGHCAPRPLEQVARLRPLELTRTPLRCAS